MLGFSIKNNEGLPAIAGLKKRRVPKDRLVMNNNVGAGIDQ